MLVFMNFGDNFGGGGGRWYIGPLITLLPLLLTMALPMLQSFFSLLLGASNGDVYDSGTQTWRRQGDHSSSSAAAYGGGNSDSSRADGGSTLVVSFVLVGFTSMVVTAALTVLLFKFVRAGWRQGFGAMLLRLLLEGFAGGWDERQGGQRAERRYAPRARSQRIEHVAKLMQGLPVEAYRSRGELERMSVAELKQIVKRRGVTCKGSLERRELVEAAAEGGNSSAASCSICCEDYEPGDVLRVLPCGHRYHLTCVDRWFLSSTDYSRPTACPMCNAPLDAMSGGGGGDQ